MQRGRPSRAKKIKLKLKYQGRRGVIAGLRRVSSPGLRRYVGADRDSPRRGGMGIAIVSTPKGVMTGNEAAKAEFRRRTGLLCLVSSEHLCYVTNWKNADPSPAQG